MKLRSNPLTALLLTLLFACSSLALPLFQKEKKDDKEKQGQQQQQQPQKTDDQKKQEPAPLFQGNVGLKSSRQGKDSATLGFNGVGPNGEVEQAVLNATPTSSDQMKAYQMGNRSVGRDSLQMFIMEGQLNPQGAAKSSK